MAENICVFESYNIIDALKMVKSAMGSDAVIVDTKKVKSFWGLGKEKIRITAVKKDDTSKVLKEISLELSRLKKSVEEMSVKSFQKKCVMELMEKGISYETSRRISFLADDEKKLLNFLNEAILKGETVKNKSLFVGSPGCGKTNFTVNLAISLKEKGKEVVFIHSDKRKEEERKYLRGFLKKKGIEFLKSDSVKDTIKKIEKISDNRTVLVDLLEMDGGLKDMIKKGSLGVFLCVESLKHYPSLSLKKYIDNTDFNLVITKMDEADYYLRIFGLINSLNSRVSYVSSIQNGAVDISDFNRESFIDRVFAETLNICGGLKCEPK
ncbi:MAG: hypothetical protein N2Z60_06480 [Elusimicrobiales bacterium]|nr:hypothetical protein [Elusimicrobiales bacterium]